MSLMKKTSLSPPWYKYLPYGNHQRLAEVKTRTWRLIDEAIDNAAVGNGGEDAPIREAALNSTCIVDCLKRAVDDDGQKLPARVQANHHCRAHWRGLCNELVAALVDGLRADQIPGEPGAAAAGARQSWLHSRQAVVVRRD